LYLRKGSFGSFFACPGLLSFAEINKAHSSQDKMPYRYSLFVNGQSLGPYERRMIVGMWVKNIVSSAQIVLRDDGLQMKVEQLLSSRDDASAPRVNPQLPDDVSTSTFSIGMWPQFNVRFGGGPMRSGALGFNGLGQVTYLGSELLFKGNRRNRNWGMSRHELRLPVAAIHSAVLDGFYAEIGIKPGFESNTSEHPVFVRIECTTAHEAQELCGLLNVPAGQLPTESSFAQTATDDLL
jgi:hypothetical protein